MPMIQGLDIILVGIMIFSGFLAMLRGLTREMLSIMSWALAAIATLLAYSQFRNQVRSFIDTPMLADATLIGAVFITSLVLFSFITSSISERVLDSRVGAVDRTLGFVFGLIRGLILVVIAYLITSQIVDPKSMPRWVQEAQSKKLIEDTGSAIRSLLPDNPESLFKRDRPSTPAPEADRT
jgi:membrane protein required for colicin V production